MDTFNIKYLLYAIAVSVIVYLVGMAAYKMVTSTHSVKKSSRIEKSIYKDFNASKEF